MTVALQASPRACKLFAQQPGWQVSVLQLLQRRYAVPPADAVEPATTGEDEPLTRLATLVIELFQTVFW